jgi:hypothetical protein
MDIFKKTVKTFLLQIREASRFRRMDRPLTTGDPVIFRQTRSAALAAQQRGQLGLHSLNGPGAGEKSANSLANLAVGLIALVNNIAYSLVNQHPIVDKARQPIGMKILA